VNYTFFICLSHGKPFALFFEFYGAKLHQVKDMTEPIALTVLHNISNLYDSTLYTQQGVTNIANVLKNIVFLWLYLETVKIYHR
jgi:hypothetical protein